MTGLFFLLQAAPAMPLPDPDTVIGAIDKNSWIGFATIMGTIILGIIRQELSARIVARKAEETKKEVQQTVAVAVDTQAAIVHEHKEELKTILQENQGMLSNGHAETSSKANQYESAVLWREYVDVKLDALATAVSQLSEATEKLRAATERKTNTPPQA